MVKLIPESVISGRITANGDPLEDMPVRIFQLRISNGIRRWEQHGNSTTDEDGAFRVADLMPGTYYAVAGPSPLPGFAARGKSSAPEFGYPEVFYPSASDLAGASPIPLAAGQQAQADFSLIPQPVYSVSGFVTGFFPNEGVELQWMNALGDRPTLPTEFDPDTGRFQSKVPAGSYVLRGQSFVEGKMIAAELPLAVNAELAGVHLALAPSVPVPIEVRMQRTRPGHS